MTYNLPKGWRKIKLGEVIELTMGQSPKSEYYNEIGDGMAFMQGNSTFGEKHPTIKRFTTKVTRIAKKNDILMSVRAPVGDLNICDIEELCIGRGLCSMRAKNGAQEFLYFLIRYYIKKLKKRESGTVFASINKNDIESLLVNLPPLEEQKVIANTLSALDDKIELNNKINKNLEQQAQAIFKHWFVDFEFPDEKGNPYRSSGGKMIKTGLGIIPRGWEVAKLENCINFREGPGIRHWQFKDKGIKFINIRCIKDNDLDLGTANKISEEEAYNRYSHFMLKEWDIIISTSGTLGRHAIVRKEHLPLCLNTSVIKFRPKKSFQDFSYIYGYLTSLEFYTHLIEKASGSVQVNFGPTHLKKINLKNPPRQIKHKYHEIVFPILKKVVHNRRENQKLSQLRDILLPKLMNGEIRIPLDKKIAESGTA